MQGYDIRLNAGLDYYFNKTFSIGGDGDGGVLGLTRPGVDLNQATGSVCGDLLQARWVQRRSRHHGVRRRWVHL